MNNPQRTDAYFYYWCGIGRGMVVTFSCDAKLQQFLNYIYLFNQKSLSLQELKPDVFIIFDKQMHLSQLLERSKHFFYENQYVFTGMNGMGHIEKINRYFHPPDK